MQEGQTRLLDQVQRAWNIASSSVGKPAIRSAPNARSGRSRRSRARELDHVGAPVPPLHALEDQIIAGLHGEMQMRHQPRLLGDEPSRVGVDRGRVERREPQPPQLRHLGAAGAAQHGAEASAGPADPCRRR